MLVTDLAMRDMDERSDAMVERLCRWLTSSFRHRPNQIGNASPQGAEEAVFVSHVDIAKPATEPIDFVRHRALSNCRRALRLAHEHRFDEARSAFHLAIAADDRLDPAEVTGFWDLPRRGMFAAIEAYEDLYRYHEAARLERRILEASRLANQATRPRQAIR